MNVQERIKKVLSVFFRFILVGFGCAIVCTRANYFELYWYFVAIALYMALYFLTMYRDGLLSKLRMLNDYVFIVFVIFGKEFELVTISFLLLPMLNSPNHSGIKKSNWLYILFILSLFLLNEFVFRWSFVLVTLVFFTINLIIESRARYYRNITNLNLKIEEFFEQEFELRKSYKFYNGIMAVLNEINILFLYRPDFEKVVCFKITDGRLVLENSSTFIWSYQVNSTEFLTEIENGSDKMKSNLDITINGVKSDSNFAVYNQTINTGYVYVFILETGSIDLYNLYYMSLLKPITARISRFLDLERSIIVENKEILRKFRDKYFHVQNAEKAMHFIRNRFNTLDNFIEMSKDNLAGNMDVEGLAMYSTELERLEHNYKLLMYRVGNILNKPDKPFSATQLERKSPNFLYGSVRNIWLDYFESFDPDLNWNIHETNEFLVEVSSDGLYIILTDWIVNLKKYSKRGHKVIFNEDEKYFHVMFRNEFNKSQINAVIDLKKDFNSVDRDGILKRTSHGVIIMKSILEEMSVTGRIENDEKNIDLILSFKKFRR